jgi:6-phosphogluconolactonase
MDNVKVVPDAAALAQTTAEFIVTLAADAIRARGHFSIGLSGGSTPRRLFELLATDDFAPRIDWANVHIFWGDERCVPPDHPDSNYQMAQVTLLAHVPLPEGNIHRMQGEIDPAQAAARYEADLRDFFGTERLPRFDLLLQGMGDDGHTASLFPGTAALSERDRWVVANHVQKLDAWRITLTVPVINAAAHVVFLVSGSSKAETVRAVLQGPHQPNTLPSQYIQPHDGQLLWMVDAAAAALLDT